METDENDEIEIKIEYDDQEIFEPNNEALIQHPGLKIKKNHWASIQKENQTILKCFLCEETFSNKEQLQIHILNIHGKSKFNRKNRLNRWKWNCHRCNQKFTSKDLMLEHTQAEHEVLKSQRVKKKPQKLIDLMPERQKSQENKTSNKHIRKYYSYEKREELKKIEGVTVSVTRIKPPYCVSCDKYYCSEKELQNHMADFAHVKGNIEFMTFIVKKKEPFSYFF